MPPAATVGDMTSHGTPLSPGRGSANVLICGRPAWRAGPADFHMCPLSNPTTPPIPHVGGSVVVGSMRVLINNLSAVREGDVIVEEGGPPNSIVSGSATVSIG